MKWDNQTKDMFAYFFAGFALILGFGLTVAGFIVSPVGEVHDSVLWILGQSLIFTAAICGVTMYVNNSIKSLKNNLTDIIKKLIKEDKQTSGNEEDN